MSVTFSSWLGPHLLRFIAIKRAAGAQYRVQPHQLARFDRFVREHAPAPPLNREAVVAFVATLESLSLRTRDNQVDVTWQALAFARRHGAPIDLPSRPPRPPANFRLRPPRLVTHEEITAVIAAARQVPTDRWSRRLYGATYATLFGLLFATGMRISEALALDVGSIDMTTGLLTVTRGKFGKSRLLPLRPSTVEALQSYLDEPRRDAITSTSPIFVSCRRRRLSPPAAGRALEKLWIRARLPERHPCLHDLRHTFAVLRVAAWYREGRDLNGMLPALSTYLGHVSVESTRLYLRANGLLLEHACRLFSIKAAALDEVLS